MLVTLPYGRRFGVLEQATAPASEPVSLSEAKLFLRVDASTEDALVTELITAARQAAETFMRRSLITQSWKLWFDDYATSVVRLPMGPVQSITGVKSYDRAGTETTIASSTYYLNAGNERLVFDVAPLGCKVEILFSAGYGSSNQVPVVIKQGVLHHIAELFDRRGESVPVPGSSQALYAPYRWEAV